MKLYYSRLACSLVDHIALREAGFVFDLERVDLRTYRSEIGVQTPERLTALRDRLRDRPAVRAAMTVEGLL